MLYRQAVSVLLMSGNTHWERLSRGVKSTDRRAHYPPYLGGIHNKKAGISVEYTMRKLAD